MRISNKSFNELIIITSLNTGSVKVIGSSPIRSTSFPILEFNKLQDSDFEIKKGLYSRSFFITSSISFIRF